MIFEGLKLMLAGMFVVYVFLSALLIMIKVSAYFFGGPEPAAQGTRQKSSLQTQDGAVAAVVSAALAAYRSGKG